MYSICILNRDVLARCIVRFEFARSESDDADFFIAQRGARSKSFLNRKKNRRSKSHPPGILYSFSFPFCTPLSTPRFLITPFENFRRLSSTIYTYIHLPFQFAATTSASKPNKSIMIMHEQRGKN